MRTNWVCGLGIMTGLFGLWWAWEEGRIADAELQAAEEWVVVNRQFSDSLQELDGAVQKLTFVVQGESDRRQLLEQIRGVQRSCGVEFPAKVPEVGPRRANLGPVVKQVVSNCKFEGTLETLKAVVESLERSEPFWIRVARVDAQAVMKSQIYGQAEQISWILDLEYLERTDDK